jgi:hypothetical protein
LYWPLIILASIAGPEPGGEVAIEKQVEPHGGWSGDLSVLQEYRWRTAGSASPDTSGALGGPAAPNPKPDQDLRLTLDGQGRGYRDHLQGQLSAALWYDIDGNVPAGQPDVFGETSDYRQPLGVIYTISAEWRRSLPLEYLRLGRQTSEHGFPLTFDGGALGLRLLERKLSLFGYAGRTVHFFETEPGLLESWVGCLGAGYRPSKNTRLEIDSRFERDGVLTQDGKDRIWVYAHSYGLTLSTRFDDGWAKLFVRGLNRSASRVGGAFRLAFPSINSGIDAQMSVQLRTLGEVSEAENPFYAILGPSLPNLRSRLEAWKEIGLGVVATLSLRAGWRFRQVLSGVPGPFNRNTGGVYFQTEFNNLGVEGLFAAGVFEWNYVPWSLGNGAFMALGGSTGYTARKLKVEAGTYYQRWKVNYYRDVEELQDVRTVYGMVSVRPLPWLEVRGRYNLDIVDRNIHSVFLTLREDL